MHRYNLYSIPVKMNRFCRGCNLKINDNIYRMRQLKISRSVTIRDSYALEKYLQEIGKVNLIGLEEESLLCARIRKGDKDALDTLIKGNLRFVVSVAKQYQHQGVGLSDLINEGNFGLITAAHRFDETKGFKFISYAVWWIRQSILQSLAEHGRLIRLPLNKVALNNRIIKANALLAQKLEREPSVKELSDYLEASVYDVESVLNITQKHASMDAPISQMEDSTLLDVMANDGAGAADKRMSHTDSLKKDIHKHLATLPERQANILKLYFGIDIEEAWSLEDIALHYSLSRERVRQIRDKALGTLRMMKHYQELRTYL